MKRTEKAGATKAGIYNEERERAGMLWKGRAWRKVESTKWLTIFAEEMKFTEFFSGKGKACKDLFSRQKPTASPTGKPGMRVEYKAAF